MKIISYQKLLNKESVIYVDVRTPDEFAESTIPGAINLPIFSNEERAEVGTIYTQQSPAAAKLLAVDLVSPKIPQMIRKIKELTENHQHVVIFCARGGMRSESIATFSELAGFKVYKLKGGYKAYRNFIIEKLRNYQLDSKLMVIHGFTGVGKTDLLYKLEDADISVIDLEGLANHRGSAFGSIGLEQPRNQKMFDSLLWEKLEEIKDSKVVAIEAESKRIGISTLPDFLLEAMKKGLHTLIKSSLESRINRIIDEYKGSYTQDENKFLQASLEAITCIRKHLVKKIGKNDYNKLVNHCKQGELEKVVEILLTEYYDPLYLHSQNKFDYFDLEIEDDDLEKIKERIIEFISIY
ncbi:tRNA 2-selenouridine synthase [Orenia metallireducens]|jgi:tRNA 2-selenouridine synthase|uniref:tRNA 2-selenouridine synthase n=1 Tax=Orenia metallireducens TaxID=1413210 RepID=A0A285HWL4_9FIRM|nr:tRNA 2-selenouridine(34) synthase MnmH [Orenia metallireducens]PRX29354.1 tRNA 2-selenouridine synthase [Orenia metallireducens]SNY40095.1 tRNA 2-selenouridine synthase [Orenia metallireducens]